MSNLVHHQTHKGYAEKQAKFIEMINAGSSYAQAVKALGIARETAHLWRRKFNLPKGQTGKPKKWRKAPITAPPYCPDCRSDMTRVGGTRNLWECQCAKEQAPAKFEAAVSNG